MKHYLDVYYQNEDKPFTLLTIATFPDMTQQELEQAKEKVVASWARSNDYTVEELDWC